MDRKALKLPFTRKRSNDWVCPSCGKGILRIKADTFHQAEKHSSRDHSFVAWDPEWIQYVFSCMLVCTNDQCKEVVSCSGVGHVKEQGYTERDGQFDFQYEDLFHPTYFTPHLKLINIPEGCPETVSKPLNESFAIFFSSPGAASNNVRITIEELLTDLNVRRFDMVQNKRQFTSLHRRVNLLPSKHADLKQMLLAIKWLGNAGSHGNGEISIDDVMDSYELMDHVLHEIYASKTKHLAALAKKVNKNKGPVKAISKPLF